MSVRPTSAVTPDALASRRYAIGETAQRAGLSVKMVRHYESLGLLPTVARTKAGYRQYGAAEIHTLRFIRRARDLGFSTAEIGELLQLWQNRRRAGASVRLIAQAHVADLDRRIQDMTEMRQALAYLADCCLGDKRPDCPVLDEASIQSP